MWDGYEFILLLQDIRLSSPEWFNGIFDVIGSVWFYFYLPLGIMAFFLWCTDKKKGIYIGMTFLSAMSFMNDLKELLAVKRPYVLHPEITVDNPKISYSCPSGHGMAAVSGYGSAAAVIGRSLISIVLIAFACLMIFSVMYMGAHSPFDIMVSVAVAAAIMAAMKYLLDFAYRDDRSFYLVFVGIALFSIAAAAITVLWKGIAPVRIAGNYGYLLGAVLGFVLEHRFVNYTVPEGLPMGRKAVIWGFGAAVMLILLFAGQSLIEGDWGICLGGFLSMVWATAAYPALLSKCSIP